MKCVYIPLIFLTGCLAKNGEQQGYVSQQKSENSSVISYNGIFPFNTDQFLELEIDLYPSAENQGRFRVKETVTADDDHNAAFEVEGFYSIFTNGQGKRFLILENSKRLTPLRRSYSLPSGAIREENFRNTDLTFSIEQDKLILYEKEKIVSSETVHHLYRRTTPVFTVEGYFMYKGDTSYFYEVNTKINWPLTKLGAYYQAAQDHNQLVSKKNDTTFLKATAYCIPYLTKDNQNINALVLKKIIQSSSL